MPTRNEDEQPSVDLSPMSQILNYRTPQTHSWGGLIRYFLNLGPWWVRPSWMSLSLLVLLAVPIVALRNRPVAWKPGLLSQIALIHNGSASPSGYASGFRPMPAHDAVFCVDPAGHPVVWRPWDNKILAQLPVPRSRFDWIAISGDESKLMTKTNDGQLIVWDANTGKLIRQLLGGPTPYLTNLDSQGYGIVNAALDHNGSRLATLSYSGDLIVWDITAPASRAVARQIFTSTSGFDQAPIMEFSRDGSRFVVDKIGSPLTIFDAETLRTILSLPSAKDPWSDSVFQWLDGGKKFLFAHSGTTSATATIYDCQTGKPIRGLTPNNPSAGAMAVTPDEKRALIAGHNSNPLAFIDLSTADGASLPCALSYHLPDWGSIKFFPDGKRALFSAGLGGEPSIVDVTHGWDLGALPLPRLPKGLSWNPSAAAENLLISVDGQHIAAQLGNGQVQVYDHVAPESRWGLIGSPWFAVMAVILALTVYSLWRDARKQSRATGPNRAAAGMVIASIPALMMLCGWCAIWLSNIHVSIYVNDRSWPLLFALWLPAGLCIRAGSRIWMGIGGILLFLCAAGCFFAFISVASVAGTPFRIFDRMMFFPAGQLKWIFLGWMSLSGVLAILLIRNSTNTRPTTPAMAIDNEKI